MEELLIPDPPHVLGSTEVAGWVRVRTVFVAMLCSLLIVHSATPVAIVCRQLDRVTDPVIPGPETENPLSITESFVDSMYAFVVEDVHGVPVLRSMHLTRGIVSVLLAMPPVPPTIVPLVMGTEHPLAENKDVTVPAALHEES